MSRWAVCVCNLYAYAVCMCGVNPCNMDANELKGIARFKKVILLCSAWNKVCFA